MIGKPRGKNKARPVYVYNPTTGRKEYVGSREKLADAKDLERTKEIEFGSQRTIAKMHVREYADWWLKVHHGAGTRRQAPTTLTHNRYVLKPFLEAFGERLLNSIGRAEALAFARKHEDSARAAAAMFNDAIDDEKADRNPLANRRQKQSEGRKNIVPLTEDEVHRMGELAMERWGGYGAVVRGWIMFGAWVGARPGEYFALEWPAVDLDARRVQIRRIKGKKQLSEVVVPEPAVEALRAMNSLRTGLLFRSPNGKAITKGLSRYYWDPVRTAFQAELKANDRRRWEELLGWRDDDKQDVDAYELRHHCGSIMADRGANEFEIAHQLGNTPAVCRETYIHTYVDRTNERVESFFQASVTDLASRRGLQMGSNG